MADGFILMTHELPEQIISPQLEVAIMGEMNSRMRDAMQVFLKALQAQLSKPGSGRWYRSRRGKGLKHRASAPGQPPAPDTKKYRDSWRVGVVDNGRTVEGWAGTEYWLKRGRRLELGGYGGGVYIAPRPHVRPALEESEKEMARILEEGR